MRDDAPTAMERLESHKSSLTTHLTELKMRIVEFEMRRDKVIERLELCERAISYVKKKPAVGDLLTAIWWNREDF